MRSDPAENGNRIVVVTTIEALEQSVPDPVALASRNIDLSPNQEPKQVPIGDKFLPVKKLKS